MTKLTNNALINMSPLKLNSRYFSATREGHLVFDGSDLYHLSKLYGTPLFIFSQRKIRENYINMKHTLTKYIPNAIIAFAYKSNSLLSILSEMRLLGAWADVVSEGEIFKAEKVGMPPIKMIFNGNNKSEREIILALQKGIMINVDSNEELDMIIQLAKCTQKIARVCIRVNVDVDSHVIKEFATSIAKSKFGIPLNAELFDVFQKVHYSKYCRLLGIHTHIGSQIENIECYGIATNKVLDFCGRLKKTTGIELEFVNLGGGLGIPFEYKNNIDLESYAKVISVNITAITRQYGLKVPQIIIEPGGYLIGTAAVALFSIGNIKHVPGKMLAGIDGGADCLLRATQDWYCYRAVCANKINDRNVTQYDLVGPLCYEGDIVATNRYLPTLERGDVIAFIDVGAYTTSLFNNYNARPTPCVVMIGEQENIIEIKRRQNIEELVAGEILYTST